jgi:hypothetical protein
MEHGEGVGELMPAAVGVEAGEDVGGDDLVEARFVPVEVGLLRDRSEMLGRCAHWE